MKNIHVLPTSNLSRLYYNFCKYQNSAFPLNKFCLRSQILPDNKLECKNQNIYITSDEEINQQTKPCWCINTIKNTWDADLSYYQGSMPQYHYKGFKKIILTTDQDLINDGVQAVDDEFLEWFVKNPSCEVVKIETFEVEDYIGFAGHTSYPTFHNEYKIIIPKEEPKQRLEKYSERFNNKENELVQGIFNSENWGNRLVNEEPKQETLEEVDERLKGKELFKESNDRARQILSEIKSLPIQETLEDKLKSLVEEWQERQNKYQDIAQTTKDEHTDRKFTYKAMATRDCWKELLKLIEDEK